MLVETAKKGIADLCSGDETFLQKGQDVLANARELFLHRLLVLLDDFDVVLVPLKPQEGLHLIPSNEAHLLLLLLLNGGNDPPGCTPGTDDIFVSNAQEISLLHTEVRV